MNNYNIVWIDRGIIISLIKYIIENYKKLSFRYLIIDNHYLVKLFGILFPKLSFNLY